MSALRLPFPSEQLSTKHKRKQQKFLFKNRVSPLHRLLPVPSIWDFWHHILEHEQRRGKKKGSGKLLLPRQQPPSRWRWNLGRITESHRWRGLGPTTPPHFNNRVNAPRLSKSNSDVISPEGGYYSGCHNDHTASSQAFFSSNSCNMPLCLTYSSSR